MGKQAEEATKMSLTINTSNPIQELTRQGQSLWLDNLRRELITSGELARLRDAGITGITSNPTIFEKAIGGSTDYDAALAELMDAGRRPDQMLWDLMLEDIQAAADIFRPVYEATAGSDGFVSIEVGPAIAGDTEQTIATAQELHRRAARPNVMVKIPATRAGLPAIRHMIGEGKHTNVTLIFSVQRYAEVVEAYLSGLEDLQSNGGDLRQVSSVASFFVSRVDTKVDQLLAAMIEASSSPPQKRELELLYGKAGIANSKMAYARYHELFAGPRWQALEWAGARVQRCLWASTSVKSTRYRDTMYVEELIGSDTVDTVPNATLAAFLDHGRVRPSLDENVSGARADLDQLAKLGIDLDQVTRELEVEGVEAFVKSYDRLLEVITGAAGKVELAASGAPSLHQTSSA
jgi:transaldolase